MPQLVRNRRWIGVDAEVQHVRRTQAQAFQLGKVQPAMRHVDQPGEMRTRLHTHGSRPNGVSACSVAIKTTATSVVADISTTAAEILRGMRLRGGSSPSL